VPENWLNERRNKGDVFYCPNGDGRVYHTTTETKLRREKDELERRLASERENTRSARAAAQLEERRARAYKGHATRVRKRAARGLCPCCNATFEDLAAHVADAHPGYADAEVAE